MLTQQRNLTGYYAILCPLTKNCLRIFRAVCEIPCHYKKFKTTHFLDIMHFNTTQFGSVTQNKIFVMLDGPRCDSKQIVPEHKAHCHT
jgi:hypothetical protein